MVNSTRTGYVRITYTTLNNYDQIEVEQAGYPQKIEVLSGEQISLPNYAALDSRYFEVELSTNVEMEFKSSSMPSWVESVEFSNYSLDRGARPRTVTATVVYKNNTNPEGDRDCELEFVATDSSIDELATVKVVQSAGDLIPDSAAGDSLAMIAIARNINGYAWEYSEPMKNWTNVVLWETTDSELDDYLEDRQGDEGYETLTRADVVGRVKEATFYIFNTEEELPYEVRYLKHCVDLNFSSNTNNDYKTVPMGESIGELVQLKRLTLFAIGLEDIDDSFYNLSRLEEFSFAANRLLQFPDEFNSETFPRMKKLNFAGNIVNYAYDLSNATHEQGEAGMEMSMEQLQRIFLWDTLESLSLSYNYNYGELPSFDGEATYTDDDIADTENFPAFETAVANDVKAIPRILPYCTDLRLNLNRFTGDLPDWILYHPNLLYFDAFTLIFYQEGRNREGTLVGFDNEPTSYDYYYTAYPYWAEKMGVTVTE